MMVNAVSKRYQTGFRHAPAETPGHYRDESSLEDLLQVGFLGGVGDAWEERLV